ncbi:65-kDa microtubule-associated protein 3 isoform X2 [Neltuma alba]|uniref:65-kDa microtubule-associated protein 3 isoform X2 n=1 Tax=Neltuma alba TaxID=207710 RepID=UPI0010A3E56A|nr:65-kDa microtubule-associated protein 3 isoform X2 [Prosopis alba]
MSKLQNDPFLQYETTCGSLLYELKNIWDEVGVSKTERDKTLFELEQECLHVYRRKVDQANQSRAQLRQEIADSEAELATICSAMGERPVHIRQSDKKAGSLREELQIILPELEEMRKRRFDRRNQFLDVQEQIQGISNEIYGPEESALLKNDVEEYDLTLIKLEKLHRQLHTLQKEKSERLKKVQDKLYTLKSLTSVLGLDFKQALCDLDPSLGDSEGSKSVSNDAIQQLDAAIQKLREVKLQRMQKLQDLATAMLELWNLMDTPVEEQQKFQNVTCNIAASEHEMTEPNTLSMEFIHYVEAEVTRLEDTKASKMKELVLRKRTELEEICRKTHLVSEGSAIECVVEAIESGSVDPACVLEQIELQIAKVKEEAFSRKEILEKVEKWLAARDEETWLEEYNRDENRYNAGKGTHLILKRAEKARALVNKMPAMVDALTSKAIAWEKERGIEFTYDGISLLSMLEEYNTLRQEKEQERRRQRDLRRLQGQIVAEQEARYGSKPSSSKPQTPRKASRMPAGGATNKGHGGATFQTTKHDSKGTESRSTRKTDNAHQLDEYNHLDDGDSSLSSDDDAPTDSPHYS